MNNRNKALLNDLRLYDLAIYAATVGYTQKATSTSCARRFQEFKKLLLKKEFETFEDLENSLYERFGILGAENKLGITEQDIKHLQDMADEFKKRDKGEKHE